MFKMTQRLRKEDAGFTLIELLIVIVVLGVLAGIAILAFDPFEQASTDACNNANTRIEAGISQAQDAGFLPDDETVYTQAPDCPE